MKWNDFLLNSNEYASVSFSFCSACKAPSIWITDENGCMHGLMPGMPMEGHLGSRIKLIFSSECIAPKAEDDMPKSPQCGGLASLSNMMALSAAVWY